MYLGQAVVAALAVLVVGSEYSTGTIHTTLAAVPRRCTMLAAKAAVLLAVVLPAAAVGVLCSLLAGRLILPGSGFTPAHGYAPLSLADGSTLRAVAGSVIYLALVALLASASRPRYATRPPRSGSSSDSSTCSRSSPRRSPTRGGSGTSTRSHR